jgi:DNA-binding beta-propeller fold protein YncE
MNKKVVLSILAVGAIALGQKITTFAGTGTPGFSGDNGPAAQAEVNYVTGLAADANGNIYLADQNNNRVRKVSTNGVLRTFAGNGTAGFSGDSGPALQAQLNTPIGVCVAPTSGAVYVNDLTNRRVRMISPSGTITTVAGNGSAVSSGDNGPATAGGDGAPPSLRGGH